MDNDMKYQMYNSGNATTRVCFKGNVKKKLAFQRLVTKITDCSTPRIVYTELHSPSMSQSVWWCAVGYGWWDYEDMCLIIGGWYPLWGFMIVVVLGILRCYHKNKFDSSVVHLL